MSICCSELKMGFHLHQYPATAFLPQYDDPQDFPSTKEFQPGFQPSTELAPPSLYCSKAAPQLRPWAERRQCNLDLLPPSLCLCILLSESILHPQHVQCWAGVEPAFVPMVLCCKLMPWPAVFFFSIFNPLCPQPWITGSFSEWPIYPYEQAETYEKAC